MVRQPHGNEPGGQPPARSFDEPRHRRRSHAPTTARQTSSSGRVVRFAALGFTAYLIYYSISTVQSGGAVTYGDDGAGVQQRDLSNGGGIPISGGVTGDEVTLPAPMEASEVNNLPVQFSIVVPSTRGADDVSDAEFRRRVEDARTWMSEQFGGDTTIRGSGGYVMDGDLIDEDVAIVESSMSVRTYKNNDEAIADFIRRKRDEWDQDTVLYKIEDRVFIYPERDYIDDSSYSADLIEVF